MRARLLGLALALLAHPASAEVPLTGTFTAAQACPAYQSISRRTNPGNISIGPGQTYDLLAANRLPATHLRIHVPSARPAQRWVAVACGTSPALAANGPQAEPAAMPAYRGTQYVLAVNWQPAFCELNSRVRECRDQRPDAFEATNFTLHGLWPQPRGNEYCNISERQRWASRDGRWRDLPALDLTMAQRRELDRVMPGSLSGLDRHEWVKHGSCYGGDQRQYYADSLALMRALNASEVTELFAANIGKRLTLAEIRAAFDAAFGAGAGERVAMDCAADGNRTLITELRINLTGPITGPDAFAELIGAADPAAIDCRSGQVDAVGFR
ncbi:ribonuclease [Devosia sp. YIM 151766]|uniref:ribonuclease T2 family protein n=1 Tax=Devosia sp. YIM 151766 TaxID=3017325 RepID=UPI00255C6373|nr:ribonuclease [Devosia sp. YIM 151766]WIY51809.1 ribonuclease [Devosia sp. YIM 151766]